MKLGEIVQMNKSLRNLAQRDDGYKPLYMHLLFLKITLRITHSHTRQEASVTASGLYTMTFALQRGRKGFKNIKISFFLLFTNEEDKKYWKAFKECLLNELNNIYQRALSCDMRSSPN